MMITGELPKTPEELKELAALKKAKRSLRQQHPAASKLAFVLSLLCKALNMVYPIVFLGSFLMLWVGGLSCVSSNISYLLAGKFSASAPQMSNDDASMVVIFLAICLGGIILGILSKLAAKLYHKYYVD